MGLAVRAEGYGTLIMVQEWDAFTRAVSWFRHNRPTARTTGWRPAGSWRPASSRFETVFPRLHALLRAATLTDIQAGSDRFLLFSWHRQGMYYGWLSPVDDGIPAGIHSDHALLLGSFRGCIEQFNSPATWILSHNDVLTAQLAVQDATFIESYEWAFAEFGGIPIDLPSYYCMAEEGNGNTTLCHRESGGVLLFAPDHSFDHVSILTGCPDLSLYTVHGAPNFAEWVNAVADQWIDPPRLAL